MLLAKAVIWILQCENAWSRNSIAFIQTQGSKDLPSESPLAFSLKKHLFHLLELAQLP